MIITRTRLGNRTEVMKIENLSANKDISAFHFCGNVNWMFFTKLNEKNITDNKVSGNP